MEMFLVDGCDEEPIALIRTKTLTRNEVQEAIFKAKKELGDEWVNHPLKILEKLPEDCEIKLCMTMDQVWI